MASRYVLDVEDVPETIARHTGPRGEVVLRRRGSGDDAVDELIVNGAFAMDSAETGSEQALAALAWPGATVLVGGLGLGFTVTALLDGRVGSVDVVEIEDALVEWAYEGATPRLGQVAGDPRVRLWVARRPCRADRAEPGSSPPGLGTRSCWMSTTDRTSSSTPTTPPCTARSAAVGVRAAGTRRGAGHLVSGRARRLWAELQALSSTAREERHVVQRGRHRIAYVIYTVRLPHL